MVVGVRGFRAAAAHATCTHVVGASKHRTPAGGGVLQKASSRNGRRRPSSPHERRRSNEVDGHSASQPSQSRERDSRRHKRTHKHRQDRRPPGNFDAAGPQPLALAAAPRCWRRRDVTSASVSALCDVDSPFLFSLRTFYLSRSLLCFARALLSSTAPRKLSPRVIRFCSICEA